MVQDVVADDENHVKFRDVRWAVVEVRGGFKTAPRYFGRRLEVA